jgi:hypothetical protein
MHSLQRFLVAIVVPALIVAIFAVSAVSAGGNAGKVTLCHWADHKFVKITVSVNSEPAHMRHGDVLTDQYGDCQGDQSQADEDNDGSDGSEGAESDSQQGSQAQSGDAAGHGNSQHSDGGGNGGGND